MGGGGGGGRAKNNVLKIIEVTEIIADFWQEHFVNYSRRKVSV